MKKIRILREPRDGECVVLFNNAGEVGSFRFEPGTTLEVPDEVAERLCLPECPSHGPRKDTGDIPGRCDKAGEDYDAEEEFYFYRCETKLVPGLAEMVEP